MSDRFVEYGLIFALICVAGFTALFAEGPVNRDPYRLTITYQNQTQTLDTFSDWDDCVRALFQTAGPAYGFECEKS